MSRRRLSEVEVAEVEESVGIEPLIDRADRPMFPVPARPEPDRLTYVATGRFWNLTWVDDVDWGPVRRRWGSVCGLAFIVFMVVAPITKGSTEQSVLVINNVGGWICRIAGIIVISPVIAGVVFLTWLLAYGALHGRWPEWTQSDWKD